MKNKRRRGYTLVELIVSVGLFALIMTLAAGAYLIVIGVNRQTEGISSGIDNLSFALETMTRTIRTGTNYGCPIAGTDCSGGNTFSVENSSGYTVSYSYVHNGAITQQIGSGAAVSLTDPSISITSLTFYTTGVEPYHANGDIKQARVTIVVSGTVLGESKTVPVAFTVETGATMRGSDL